MSGQFKSFQSSHIEDSVSYSDADLKRAYETFVQEDAKHEKNSLANFPNLIGSAMVILAFLYAWNSLFFNSDTPGLNGLIGILPAIGGVLITMIGLGWFSRRSKSKKQSKVFNETSSWEKGNSETYSGSAASASSSFSGYSYSGRTDSEFEKDYYEAKKSRKRKIFRSRKDKRILGVCGGLANYLGVSSFFLRLVALATLFFGYGSPVLIYFLFAAVMPKEPTEAEEL